MLYRVIALLFALVMSVPALAAPACTVAAAVSSASAFDAVAADESAPAGNSTPAGELLLDEQAGQSPSEGAMDAPALMMARADAKAPLLTMSRPRPYAAAAWRAPYLDGPQRPPCAKHLHA